MFPEGTHLGMVYEMCHQSAKYKLLDPLLSNTLEKCVPVVPDETN